MLLVTKGQVGMKQPYHGGTPRINGMNCCGHIRTQCAPLTFNPFCPGTKE